MEKINKNLRIYFLFVSFLIITLYSIKGVAMSFFSATEVVLFSPMEGVMTFEGKPAVNAKIVRTIIWKGDEGETDVFYTSENGEFKLPIKREKVRIPMLAEFVISQSIFVVYNEDETQIWGRSKRSIDLDGELGGKPQNFRCELTDEVEYLDVEDGLFGTSCKWDAIEKIGEK